jgi:flagellar hook assembly protein FlgD
MTNKNVSQQVGPKAVTTGPTQDVDFTTTEVSLNLKDHTGGLMTDTDAGTASYYSPTTGTWYNIGGTGTNGYVRIELLPVSGYHFRMTYAYVTQQLGPMAVSLGPTQAVDFQTGQLTVRLEDASHNPLSGGNARYYDGAAWRNIGTTDGTGMLSRELLPQNYYVDMTYSSQTKQHYPVAVTAGGTITTTFTWNGVSLSKPGEKVVVIPKEFGLSQNYPNPFNPTTTIDFQLPEATEVTLAIYNVVGEKVRILEQGQKPAGSYKAIWDGRNDQGEMVANGFYIYRLTAGTFTAVKRMVFMK